MDPYTIPDFDIKDLLVSISTSDGELMLGQMPLTNIEFLYQNKIRSAILFGVRIGAAILTLIAMHLVSKKSRTKLLFLANQMSLIMLIIHSALYFRFLLGPFSSVMMLLTNLMDPRADDANDINVSVATNVFVLLMIVSVQISLAVQTRSVFHAWLKSRIYVTVGLIILSLIVTCFWTIHTVASSILLTTNITSVSKLGWTRIASDVSFATSISFASLMLVIKLVLAIKVRKQLGKKPLGYTKVLIIMSTQSLVVPTILIIVNYALPKKDSWILSGVAYLVVVLSLPLSSIWATTVNDEEMQNNYLMSALSDEPEEVKESKLKTVFMSRLRPFSTFTNRDEEGSVMSTPALPSPESDITFLNSTPLMEKS